MIYIHYKIVFIYMADCIAFPDDGALSIIKKLHVYVTYFLCNLKFENWNSANNYILTNIK